MKKVLNQDEEILYAIHFPGSSLMGYENASFLRGIKDKIIKISKDISVISPMNEEYYNNSFIGRQLRKSGIKLYNSAMDEKEWINTKKFDYILKDLNLVNTKYCLVCDGRDTILVNDLDDVFIETYKKHYDKKVVFNATTVAFPEVYIEPLEEILKIKSRHKFLNAGICFGETNDLKKIYSECRDENLKYVGNWSEQYIVRLIKQKNNKITVDYDCHLFKVCHLSDTILKDDSEKIVIM